MKLFILFILFTTSVFGLSINDSLLKIHATLLPKIYLMDYDYEKKIIDNTIKIVVMYETIHYEKALSLKEKIDTKYSNGIKSYKLEVKLTPYKKCCLHDANIYYLFPSDTKNVAKVLNKAEKTKSITFSYLKDDLKLGVMISLEIGNKVKPLLNLSAIKNNNISFRPVLLNISNIFRGTFNNINIRNIKSLLFLNKLRVELV